MQIPGSVISFFNFRINNHFAGHHLLYLTVYNKYKGKCVNLHCGKHILWPEINNNTIN